MTRPFALRLILLGLIVSAAAYSYHRYQLQRAKQETIDYAISVSQHTIARQSFDLGNDLMSNYELLNDYSKEKMFPLKDIYRKVESAQDEFQSGYNEVLSYAPLERISDQQRLDDIQEIRTKSESLLQGVLSVMLEAYSEMQESIGVTEKEMEALEESLYAILQDDMPTAILNDKPLNRQENHLRLNLVRASFCHRLQELLFSASSTFCVRSVQFDRYFPVILSDFDRVLKPGERRELKIGVGSYTADLNGKEVELRVNGQHLVVGREGIARYAITGSGTGEKHLFLSATVTDRITGRESEGESLVRYSVE